MGTGRRKTRPGWIAAVGGSVLLHGAVLGFSPAQGLQAPPDTAPPADRDPLAWVEVEVEVELAPRPTIAAEVTARSAIPNVSIRKAPRALSPVEPRRNVAEAGSVPEPLRAESGLAAALVDPNLSPKKTDVLEVFRSPGDTLAPRVEAPLPAESKGHLAFTTPPTIGSKAKLSFGLPKTVVGKGGVSARIADDGSMSFRAPGAVEDLKRWGGAGVIGVQFKFDLTDAVMRAAGQDPYASEKRRLADATRVERQCMAQRAQERRQAEALFHMTRTLESLIAAADLAWPARREAIFDLWDDCAQAPRDGGQNLAASARAQVLHFIRQRLPAGSAQAFTRAELVALNRRRSMTEAFDPYGTLDPRVPDAGM